MISIGNRSVNDIKYPKAQTALPLASSRLAFVLTGKFVVLIYIIKKIAFRLQTTFYKAEIFVYVI